MQTLVAASQFLGVRLSESWLTAEAQSFSTKVTKSAPVLIGLPLLYLFNFEILRTTSSDPMAIG